MSVVHQKNFGYDYDFFKLDILKDTYLDYSLPYLGATALSSRCYMQ